jgi:hypothetical protein
MRPLPGKIWSASSLRAIPVIGDSANVRTGPEVTLTGVGYVALETVDPQKAIRIAKK